MNDKSIPLWDVEVWRQRADGLYWAWIGTVRAANHCCAKSLALDKYAIGANSKLRVRQRTEVKAISSNVKALNDQHP